MRRGKAEVWVLSVVAGIFVLCAIIALQPISRTKDTPLMRRYSSLHQLSSKLRWYADQHSAFPDGATVSSNLDDLVSFGVLLPEEAAYIRTNQIEYRGFNLLGRVGADVVVFECAFSNTPSPGRVTAYSDGHVVYRAFQRRQ